MSENYKKYLDKAKKKSSDSSSAKEKQDKEYSELYKKFNLKYAMGTPSVAAPAPIAIPSMSANTSSSLSPLLKNTYSNHLKHLKKLSEGGQVKDSQQKEYQAKEYFGKDAYGDNGQAGGMSNGGPVDLKVGSQSESPSYYSNGGPVYKRGEFKNEDFSDKGLKTIVPNYDEGTEDVSPFGSFAKSLKDAFSTAKPSPTPSKEETRDEKYDRIRKENTERSAGQRDDYQGFSEGTPNAQTPEEAGIEARARRSAVLKAAEISDEQTPEEIQIEAEEKKRREQEPAHYNKGTMDVSPKELPVTPFTSPGNRSQKMKNMERKPFHFADGTDNVSPDDADLQDKAKKYGWTPEHVAYLKSLRSDIPQAPTQQPTPTAMPTGTDQGIHLDPNAAQNVAQAFANGGMVQGHSEIYKKFLNLYGGLPKVPKLENPLAVVHSPAEKKVPLNIPRGAKIHFPKRLKPVGDVTGFDEGTSSVEQAQESMRKAFHFADGTPNVPMQLDDVPIAPSTPYPGEEEDALNTADSSTQGQLQQQIDSHNNSQDVLQQIDQALGKNTKPEDYPKFDSSKRKPLLPMNDEGESSDDQHDKEEQDAEDKALIQKLGKEDNEALKSSDATTEAQLDKEDTSAADEESSGKKKDEEKQKKQDDSTKDEKAAKDEVQNKDNPAQRLLDAQQQQRDANLGNQLGRIGDIFASSKGNYRPTMEEYYKDQEKNADLPVKQLEQQIQMEKFDPNSNTSKSFRQYLTKFGGQDVAALGNISAAQAEQIAPMAFKQFEAQQAQAARSEDRKTMAQSRVDAANIAAQQRLESAKDRNAMMQAMMQEKRQAAEAAAKDKAEQKATDAQNKAFMKTSADLEQMRGSPAVSQAEKDIYASQKADSLAGLYPDPNKLSPTQVRLLATEVSKVASGGAPTMEELKGVTPDTFRGKLAGVVQKLTNSPSPANAGDFIKQYQDYTKALTKDAQKVIMDRYGRIIEPRKKLLGDDHYQDLQDSYINRFKNVANPSDKEQPKESKTVVRKGYNPSTNQTQLIYNDGTKEIVDGKQ